MLAEEMEKREYERAAGTFYKGLAKGLEQQVEKQQETINALMAIIKEMVTEQQQVM
jgi:flagellar biosynthesis/type III secretory pathway protein FliH